MSVVRVDFAASECDCAIADEDATSSLPNNGSTSVRASTPTGAMGSSTVACLVASAHIDVTATSELPNNGSTSVRASAPTVKGAMEELSGKVQKVSTHVSGVGIDVTAGERDYAAVDDAATSILPNEGSM